LRRPLESTHHVRLEANDQRYADDEAPLPTVTSVKVVENPGEPSRVMGQAACEVMLSSGSVWAASIRENASTCM